MSCQICSESKRRRQSNAHKDVEVVTVCTHVLDRGPAGVRSPLDKVLRIRTACGSAYLIVEQPSPQAIERRTIWSHAMWAITDSK